MKFWSVLFLFLTVSPVFAQCPQCPTGPVGPPVTAVPSKIVQASVHVSAGGWTGSGTVFHVQDGVGLILTNKHVAPDPRHSYVVTFVSGARLKATWVSRSDSDDLACLAISANENTPFVPLASESPKRGDKVYQVGYPGGRRREQEGEVIGFRANWNPVVFVPSVQSDHGDSGSGIFYQKDQTLCGVIWGYTGAGGGKSTCAVELYQVRLFTGKIFPLFPGLRDRVRPETPSSPVTPQGPGGIQPESPNAPRLPPPPDVPQERPLEKRIKALEELMGKHPEILESLKTRIMGLEKMTPDMIKELEDKLAKSDSKLGDFLAKHPDLIKALEAKITGVDGKVSVIPALIDAKQKSGFDLVQVITAGSTGGGAGLLALLAGYAFNYWRNSKKEPVASAPAQAPAPGAPPAQSDPIALIGDQILQAAVKALQDKLTKK